jgi:AbiV family abortive infection protein
MSEPDQSNQQQRARDIEAMQACVQHGRDLIESARAVHGAGHPNIAFHLAVLALEELGRRDLIAMQRIAESRGKPNPLQKHAFAHTKKIFWCLFGLQFITGNIQPKRLTAINELATTLHRQRMAGLYVNYEDDDLHIPSDAIDAAYCMEVIGLAEAHLQVAEAEKPAKMTQEDIDRQVWFLSILEKPENVKVVFSTGSFAKLTELHDVKAWAMWLKDQFDQAEAQSAEYLERELRRSKELPEEGTKDKWRLRIRITSQSHSVRPKALTPWNQVNGWIRLIAVPEKPNQLIVEFTVRDNMPVASLWNAGWEMARHFVAALNIATMGFWWWHTPKDIDSYYESLTDLETNSRVEITRLPSLKIDWGAHRVLTEQDLVNASGCFTALPRPGQRDEPSSYDCYLSGLTYLSLNDVHWQCEALAFGSFFESLKAMMKETGALPSDADAVPLMQRFLRDVFPKIDDHERFGELFDVFDKHKRTSTVITLQEAAVMKIFCDTYFLDRFAKPMMAQRRSRPVEESGQSGAGCRRYEPGSEPSGS